jgi:branched-chain amino acid transport system permease protein
VFVNTTWPLLPTLALAMIVGCVVAIVIGALSIRRQGVYFVMLTLGFAQLFYFLAYTFSDLTGGDNGLTGVPRRGIGFLTLNSPWSYYAFVAVVFLISFAALQRIATSTFGRTLLAIRDNGERARAIGFPVRIFKVAAFAVSGALTGLAGALHALLIGIAPLSDIDYHMSESLLVMTIIGGTGNLFGSVLGAAFYLIVSDTLSAIWPRWLLLLGVLLVVLALYVQKGIWGLIESAVRFLQGRRGRSSAVTADPAGSD